MTLLELKRAVDRLLELRPRSEDYPVRILTENPAMGSHASVGLRSLMEGIDWDSGHILISTDDPVLRVPARTKDAKSFEDCEITLCVQARTGTALSLKHRGGYVGDNLRTKLEQGDSLRIIKLAKPAPLPARPQPAHANGR